MNGGYNDLRTVPQERAVADLPSGQLLARVMASLLPPPDTRASPSNADESDDDEEGEPPAVLDPACSEGTLLLAVADRFGDHVMLVGQEIDEKAAALAAVNMRGHPLGAPYDIQTGDSLINNQLSRYLGAAAAVVCEPPLDARQWPSAELVDDPRWRFGVPEAGGAELAWVQHCYAHLRPRGVAVSPRTGVQPSGRSVRAALVRSGVLRDVIALPKGMGSAPDTDRYLWVLQRPYPASDHAASASVDIGDADLSHFRLEFTGRHNVSLSAVGAGSVGGHAAHGGGRREPEMTPLSEVIAELNDRFGLGLGTADEILVYQQVVGLVEDTSMQQIALMNDESRFGQVADDRLDDIVAENAERNTDFMKLYFDNDEFQKAIKEAARKRAYRIITEPARDEALARLRAEMRRETGTRDE